MARKTKTIVPATSTPGAGFVYLIGATPPTSIKIGKATSIAKRLTQLQTSHPTKLELIHSWEVSDARAFEEWMHGLFKPRRLRGEWFAVRSVDVIAAGDMLMRGEHAEARAFASAMCKYWDAEDAEKRHTEERPRNYGSHRYADDKAAWQAESERLAQERRDANAVAEATSRVRAWSFDPEAFKAARARLKSPLAAYKANREII